MTCHLHDAVACLACHLYDSALLDHAVKEAAEGPHDKVDCQSKALQWRPVSWS